MINFECPNCKKKIKAPDSAGGKKANCPGCKSPISVPMAEPELVLAVDEPAQIASVGINAGRMNADDVRPSKRGPSLLMIAGIGTLVLVSLCCGVFSIFINNLPKPAPKTEQQIANDKQATLDRSLARRCESDVQTRITALLKAPKTAKFELDSTTHRSGDEVVAIVTGNVTSQNAFGAMLTDPLLGMYLQTPKQYTLVQLTMGNETLFVDEKTLESVEKIKDALSGKK
jgi:hypothetical protein